MLRILVWLARAFGFVLCFIALGLVGFRAKAAYGEGSIATEIAPATGHFVHAHDVDLFVQEAGPSNGMAVLFVHGTGAWSETWRDTMTALAGRGFSCNCVGPAALRLLAAAQT